MEAMVGLSADSNIISAVIFKIMNYTDSLVQLAAIFQEYEFDAHVASNRLHAAVVEVDACENGTKILISFPGYKALKGITDYRVDLVKKGAAPIPLSHTNIIVDIYNKCVNGGMDTTRLKKALIYQACNNKIDYNWLRNGLTYSFLSPSNALLAIAISAHHGKGYQIAGNKSDLELEELFKSIKWIVIQEDINYPMPKFLGRRMSFGRYLEIIHSVETETHSLTEVIQRAFSHTRPTRWSDMDYSFETLILNSAKK